MTCIYRHLAALCVLLALGAIARGSLVAQAPSAASQTADRQVTISIVGTNDLHGGVLPRDGRGGLALLSGYVKALREARLRDGGAVLLIDGGDMFQGTLESNLSEGAAVVAAYNALGYTAATVGNHEFDFGPAGPAATPARPGDDPRGALKARAAEATFPFLAANLLDESTARPVAWPNVRPSTIVEAAGVKIGIVGVMTKEALTATIAANVGGLRVAPLAPAIAAEAARLRSSGAAVVIVTAHAGGRCSNLAQPTDLASCDPASEIVAVARELPPGSVDVIVAGHTHAGMAHEVEGIAIIESFATGRSFGRVDLTLDAARRAIVDRKIFPPRDLCAREDPSTGACDTAPVPASSSRVASYEGTTVLPDPSIAAVLEPALAKVRELKARPLGVNLETPIRRQASGDSPLGNLFTDALRASIAGADAAIHNTAGGLRADLPQGPLIFGSVFEVMPFDNKVATLRLTGAQVRTVFGTHLRSSRRTVGVSGIRVRAACSGGTLDVALSRASGAAIADDDVLTVAVTDFLATGGDGILKPVIPPGGFQIPDDAPLARDALASYLQGLNGPLRESQFVDTSNPRLVLSGGLPGGCAQ
ncbi:MAG: bifunctional metallophosphatase/5'-nucleotidase [Vicinamibacterales bacterium]